MLRLNGHIGELLGNTNFLDFLQREDLCHFYFPVVYKTFVLKVAMSLAITVGCVK